MRSWLTVKVIQQQFSGQPMEVLCGADDEVLTIVKNDKTKNPYNPISNQMFNQFVSIRKLITDFH
jgi:pre-mRNA-splicing helicase BRR2